MKKIIILCVLIIAVSVSVFSQTNKSRSPALKKSGQSRQDSQANNRLEKEVRQFFVDYGLVTTAAAIQQKNDLKKALTDDFIMTSETIDAGNSGTQGLFAILPLLTRQEAVAGKESFAGKKLYIVNRNLRVVQNGETVIANYDTLYFSGADNQKKLKARERHLSVFVRRGGNLLWMADQSAKIPDAAYNETPRGWMSHFASAYRMGIDVNIKHSGEGSVFIERDAQSDPKKGVEMSQVVPAKNYRGKRVQLTSYIKSENLTGDAGVFLLVDQSSFSDSAMLQFLGQKSGTAELLEKKGLQGTNDWKPLTVTIDVPNDAEFLTISVLLRGAGKIWLDDFSIKAVGQDVPVSYEIKSKKDSILPPVFVINEPINLDFEDN
ncbi:MAG: hypothetical protein ABJA66_10700 [Actinomycetota bacterium]